METYHWERNVSKESCLNILNYKTDSKDAIQPPVEYGKSVEALMNDGENEYNINKYKEQVLKLLTVA
jgi:small subunit ribosomal protein S35